MKFPIEIALSGQIHPSNWVKFRRIGPGKHAN